MNRTITLATALLLTCLAAHAQAQPSPIEPNDWAIETVTVTAPSSGPAVWRVTKGDAEVDIFGIIEPLPEHFAWNSQHLAKLMDGARLVLLPVGSSRVDLQACKLEYSIVSPK